MVFGDATLNNMTKTYATTKEEMLNISGVGEIKYERYGKYFEDIIEKYLIEKNIDKNEVIKIEENSSQDSEFFEVTTDKDLFEKL